MIPVPFREMADAMILEYLRESTIFGIHADGFFQKRTGKSIEIFNQKCSTPVGPAAGPHTQLAQNIISAYLTGGRFIELKTVQILDTLEIDKPCIDARDEGYNVEWSTEFTLTKAYREYIKAWVLVHLIETLFPSGSDGRSDYSFIFNMSVGYDLKGIKTDRMQTFIDSMIDSSENPYFLECIEQLHRIADDLAKTPFAGRAEAVGALADRISPKISPSVTLSTMHGCPPKEIEAICSYLLEEKGLNTFVKLNPTLLGYEKVRAVLDELGFSYITLSPEAFSHDLQYPDAAAMLKRLVALAEKKELGFGIKLSNTLGTVNDQGVLPGDEMYMSGRSLYPLTTLVAAKLSAEFEGKMPISYSGGANADNIAELFESGIRPITLATDLLKPGGYERLSIHAKAAEASDAWELQAIDAEMVASISERALSGGMYHKDLHGFHSVKVGGDLPLFDCYLAPCVSACPIHQDVPEYIHLTGEGRYAEALDLIYDKNPLPNITGHICDHQCMYHCTRIDFEGPVDIREMKRIAVDNGFDRYKEKYWIEPELVPLKAAVIGAGPAGLSAAFFLARSGCTVTVFEREKNAGGVVSNVIPEYRLPAASIQGDIDFVEAQGVEFCFGVSPEELTITALKDAGFTYLLYGIGAEKDNPLPLEGAGKRGYAALDFLHDYRHKRDSLELGKHVVVVGGGNTAMDGARSAKTLPGVEEVTVLYRRSRFEMPADLEEYENARDEGVKFIFLANPERYDADGTLLCRKMELGEPDASGRRRPVPTDETFSLAADTVITAIGEKVDSEKLKVFGLPLDKAGYAVINEETLESGVENVYLIGDAHTGPSTIVGCIAEARKAAEAILDQELGPEEPYEHDHDHECDCGHDHEEEHECSCNSHYQEQEFEPIEEIEAMEDEFFADIRNKRRRWVHRAERGGDDQSFALNEASRCLECSYLCNKCVSVCPNRANAAVDVRDLELFDNPYQIVHIDSYCNECGNCATFCPWDGKPYKDKLTIFISRKEMDASENPGIALENDRILLRENRSGPISDYSLKEGSLASEELSDKLKALIELIIDRYAYLFGTNSEA